MKIGSGTNSNAGNWPPVGAGRLGRLCGQEGFALIIAIAVLVATSVLSAVVVSVFSSRMGGSTEYATAMKAFYVAQGGIEKAIKSYYSNCSGYTGETGNLGGGTFTTQVFSTDFSGASLPSSQLRLRSMGTAGQSKRVVEQIVTCNQLPIIAQAAITIGSQASVDCGDTTCSQSNVNARTCSCAKQNTSLGPAPSMPTPTPGAPPGGCPTGTSQAHYTWPAGTYSCNTVSIGSQAVVTLTGPVTLFSGVFTIGSQGQINAGGQASNLLVVGSGTMSVGSQAVFTGAFYAPGQSIQLGSQSQVTGTLDGNSITLGSQATIHYNATAGNNSSFYAAISGGGNSGIVLWREVIQ